jgi:hypothetical protein
MVQSASVAYLVGGQLIVVDATSGDFARRVFGWPPGPNGSVVDVAASATDVALSPDGRMAIVTVETHQRDEDPTVRVLDLESATESVVPDVTPVDDAGDLTLRRPSVYAWANDSSMFYCACAQGQGAVPGVAEVSIGEDGTSFAVTSPAPDVSPLQITAGTAGVASQLEAQGGPWFLQSGSSRSEAAIPPSYAAALGRGDGETYIALRGDGFTIGEVNGEATVRGTLEVPAGIYEFAAAIDVDAATGGFVATTVAGNYIEQTPADPISVHQSELMFIRDDGAQRLITTLPEVTTTASVASDLAELPPDPDPDAGVLPRELPGPEALPVLEAGAIEAATAAYAASGQLVVTDAATGAGYRVDLTNGQNVDRPVLINEGAGMALSPDGRYLLVSAGNGGRDQGQSERLWFVDLAQALAGVQEIELAAPEPGLGAKPSRLAWSPDGQTFACICAAPDEPAQLHLANMDSLPADLVVATEPQGLQPDQIAWGLEGLVANYVRPTPHWSWVTHAEPDPDASSAGDSDGEAGSPPSPPDPFESSRLLPADIVLLSPYSRAFMEWSNVLYKITTRDHTWTSMTSPNWFAGDWTERGPVVVTYTHDYAPSERLEVEYLESDGTNGSVAGAHPISTLPPGTVAVSFAADLLH